MNTLKNYLEGMFANMPNTPEVRKAKDELWQMMEDKYNELIDDGKNENEAIGTVIAEFGNLEDLKEDLGLEKELHHSEESNPDYNSYENVSQRQILDFEYAKTYVDEKATHALWVSIGVMLCILSPIMPILTDCIKLNGAIGVVGLMACIGTAVFLFVYSSNIIEKWDYLKNGNWMIDYNTAKVLQDEKNRFRSTYAIRQTIGILLCVLCWLPAVIIDESPLGKFDVMDGFGAIILFLMVGIGVMMIVHSNMVNSAYDDLLKINDKTSMSGNYVKAQKKTHYINDNITSIMEVYWTTITSIYLIWSFITFDWHISWIIWPIAGIIKAIIDANLSIKE